MNLFNWRPKTITLDDQKSVLWGAVQALTFRNDPKLLAHISLYEQRLTKNFQIDFSMLKKLQSPLQPVLARKES